MRPHQFSLIAAIVVMAGCQSVPKEISLKSGLGQETKVNVKYLGAGIFESSHYKAFEEHPSFVEDQFARMTYVITDQLGIEGPLKNPATWVPMEAFMDVFPEHPECACYRLQGRAKTDLGVDQLATYFDLTCGRESFKSKSGLVKGHGLRCPITPLKGINTQGPIKEQALALLDNMCACIALIKKDPASGEDCMEATKEAQESINRQIEKLPKAEREELEAKAKAKTDLCLEAMK